MASTLDRLGRFSYRRRRTVITLWLGVLVLVGWASSSAPEPTVSSFSIPGTEAQETVDLLEERFPEMAAGSAEARVVLAAGEGARLDDPATATAVQEVLAEMAAGPQVLSVTDPFTVGPVSEDGTVALAQVTYDVGPTGVTDEAREALTEAADAGRQAGLVVELAGSAVQAEPVEAASVVVGLAVAALVLVVTFGSFVAAGLPLLTAALGVLLGLMGVTIVSGLVDLSGGSSTGSFALMLGLAVGIDYALFIVSRYRGELAAGRSGEDAAGRAVGTAGSAVVFAGLTVVIALAALAVVRIPVITEMGVAAAGTVAVAVLVALTLLPALLGAARKRIRGRASSSPDADGVPRTTIGTRWVRFVTRRPVPVLVAGVAVLLAAALPALDLRLGLSEVAAAPEGSTQRASYQLVDDAFGPGFNGPLTVVVDAPDDVADAASQAADAIARLEGVVAVAPPVLNSRGDTAVLSVIPATGPSTQETQELVDAIRDGAEGLLARTGATLGVTGETAMNLDISERMTQALAPYLAVVALLALVLLTLVFRSVLVPLKAVAGFLLSIAATFGAVVAVFQWGWGTDLLGVSTAPIFSLVPILVIGVIFGLAMDYELFLVTRMREEHVHGAAPREAVVKGFTHGARVVTAAATIMISVFASSMLAHQLLLVTLGFAFTVAIVFDAFVVRMTLVPAVMALLGRHAWWLPRWLDRILPRIDIEGEALADQASPAPRPLTPTPV
ncbi:MMPL family transporter [Actinotalea subterranea]|uniref:MMPL family transporter n=1 Tax=Actinotalea subterranea TaxID=2607497 RepID=UPI0011EF95FA|nr:MMPL family transporter [Actinotalea subterranea]